MRKSALYFICMAAMVLALGACPAVADDDYYLGLESTSDGSTPDNAFTYGDGYFYVNIQAGNNGGSLAVAGAAFTLEYPSDILEGPTTDGEGVPQNDSVSSIFPFEFTQTISGTEVTSDTFRTNASTLGSVLYAGAVIDESTGAAPTGRDNPSDLFTTRFRVKDGAAPGPFVLTLKQTMLWNPDAGYGSDPNSNGTQDQGEDSVGVTALVGALAPGTGTGDDGDFPVLIDSFTAVTATLWVDDGDSIDNQWEMDNYGDLITITDASDQDGDGYLDRHEIDNDTNLEVRDDPFGADYDVKTDTNAPYQKVTGNPSMPRALNGESFTFTVQHETVISDPVTVDENLILTLHYNSDDLTFGDIVDESANTTFETDTSVAADSLITVTVPHDEIAQDLFDVTFTSDAALIEGDTSVISFTADADDDFTFYSENVTYTVGPAFTLDIDGNGEYKALSDGILILRYLYGFRDATLIDSALETGATRTVADDIETYIQDAIDLLDIDGNGEQKALSDGILVLRYLYGFRDATLIDSALETGATRTNADDIEDYIESLKP